MKIIGTITLLDGGSKIIMYESDVYSQGTISTVGKHTYKTFVIDKRVGSSAIGKFYDRYPDEKGAMEITDEEFLNDARIALDYKKPKKKSK